MNEITFWIAFGGSTFLTLLAVFVAWLAIKAVVGKDVPKFHHIVKTPRDYDSCDYECSCGFKCYDYGIFLEHRFKNAGRKYDV
jgi:hypothetical protein